MSRDFITAAHPRGSLCSLRDLLDVCQAQKQFAPRGPLPAFGGPKGADVTTSLLDIQVQRTALKPWTLTPQPHVYHAHHPYPALTLPWF